MNENKTKETGENTPFLAKLMQENKLTITELARITGIKRTTLNDLYLGKTSLYNTSVTNLFLISSVLDKPMDILYLLSNMHDATKNIFVAHDDLDLFRKKVIELRHRLGASTFFNQVQMCNFHNRLKESKRFDEAKILEEIVEETKAILRNQKQSPHK